jgi:hypothetical protein
MRGRAVRTSSPPGRLVDDIQETGVVDTMEDVEHSVVGDVGLGAVLSE